MAHSGQGFHGRHLWLPAASVVGVGVLALIPADRELAWLLTMAIILLAAATAITEMLIRDVSRTYRRSVSERFITLSVLLVTIVLVFVLAYLKLGRVPDQIAGIATLIDAIYFTLATSLTVGFGDIAPSSQLARFIVILQMIFTVLIAATGVRLLADLMRRSLQSGAGE